MPKPNDIVLAKRKEGWGLVRIASDLPDYEGWKADMDSSGAIWWREGASIPMRFEEAEGREDCDVVTAEKPKGN